MRYLIVSDLHSNAEALQAVLEAAEGRYDRVICCGDLVGYGADPNATVDWARQNVSVIVRGNHDKASCGVTDGEDFNPLARYAALWTRAQLAENLEYLRNLPTGQIEVDGFHLVHGSVEDEDQYVFFSEHAGLLFPRLQFALTFFGHTHIQGGFVREGMGPVRTIPVAVSENRGFTAYELVEREQYLVNPGSVGQPRDGNARAAFVIYDSGAAHGVVEYRRAPYDVAAAQQKIRAAGLPPRLADRLAVGR